MKNNDPEQNRGPGQRDPADRIGTARISKLLFEFSVPAIVGMLVNAVYNIVDRIYVGQGVDPLGIAGITVAMPLMMLPMAFSMLIGIGANSLFSIRLGEGRRDEVEKIMGHAFALLFLIPLVSILSLLFFMDYILIEILGVSEAVFPFAKTYLRIILYGGVFSAMGPGINHFIRSDGHPRTSMFTQILGAVINIILDPIFIFVFDWGIAGAAWATIISQFVSFCWVIFYFNSRWTRLRFHIREMRLRARLCLKIMAIGFAPFTMQLAISLVNILLNRSLFRYGGDVAVSAMGIVYSILVIIFMPLQGINQGAQPLIGYNYGAKKYRRVRETYKLAVLAGTVFAAAGFILLQLFPGLFIRIFRNEEGELLDMGKMALRICTIFLPVLAFQIFSSNFFQSIGKPVQGTLLSLSRQILFYIPLLLLLPRFFGITGVYAAMPSADFCSTILSFLVMRGELRELRSMEEGLRGPVDRV
ncbi:MAG: MATE family efflux transporter [Treponema sp.]|jgi:putative MATE family efflux protein|nr:MATE family efflux transporter [Treponema sp.]